MKEEEKSEKAEKKAKNGAKTKNKPRKKGFRQLRAEFNACFVKGKKESKKDFKARIEKAWRKARHYGRLWANKHQI
jgi:hypothetical protein